MTNPEAVNYLTRRWHQKEKGRKMSKHIENRKFKASIVPPKSRRIVQSMEIEKAITLLKESKILSAEAAEICMARYQACK